jgi:hypothetical protein
MVQTWPHEKVSSRPILRLSKTPRIIIKFYYYYYIVISINVCFSKNGLSEAITSTNYNMSIRSLSDIQTLAEKRPILSVHW